MTDKAALPNKQNTYTTPDNDISRDIPTGIENGVGEGVSDPRQTIFDARFAKLTDGFGQACEQENVTLAVAIAIHPEEKHPIVFIKGHEYDIAKLLTRLLREMTRNLMTGLNPDPNYEEDD